MTRTFSEALQDALDSTGKSLRSIAHGAGVSYEQLKKVKQGKSQSTNVDDALRVANYFGLSLDEFLGDTTISDRQEVVALYMSLSERERALLLAASRGIRVEHLDQA